MNTGARRFPQRRRRRPLRLPAAAVAVAAAGWIGGLVWFADHIPRTVAESDRQTDAIVVLTGGSGRLATGLDLIASGQANKLFVSGVYRGVDVAALLDLVQQDPAGLDCCIVIGYSADDTRGNARETAAWMAAQGYRTLRLVTANYHMQRSILEFRRAMPAVELIPHPVAPARVRLEDWWRRHGTARLVGSEFNKFLWALTIGGVLPATIDQAAGGVP